jgi:beta-lactamase superfamily II metal-dependent hydrolase
MPARAEFAPSGKLEIRYINVGQGGATLIIGPDGTRVLYDFGWVDGHKYIVPYLRDRAGITPEDGLHYTFVSHRDADHYTGYRGVSEAGYDVLVANFDPGSSKTGVKMEREWLKPATETSAGSVRAVPVGLAIALGDGAEIRVVAAGVVGENGQLRKDQAAAVKNENDRSIALLVRYGRFSYILDGDLGAGPETCTDHQTNQIDVQTRVARALIARQWINSESGIDILHVAHHGSESSTSAAYFNLMKPTVALISVGPNQHSFLHPREDVVDRVLIEGGTIPRADCAIAIVEHVLQTDVGKEGNSSTGRTSFTGTPVGDIEITTDGKSGYNIITTGRSIDGTPTLERMCKTFVFGETSHECENAPEISE